MHKLLYRTGKTLAQATSEIAELAQSIPQAAADVALMSQFLAHSTRGIAR
jgi:UDP-N-acetylglucosamine acyltransferase